MFIDAIGLFRDSIQADANSNVSLARSLFATVRSPMRLKEAARGTANPGVRTLSKLASRSWASRRGTR